MPTTNYQNVHFYIIDSPTSDGHGPLKAPPARVRESDHRFFCRLLEDDIKELFGIKVERLYCPANTSDSSFSDRVDNLLKDKKVGDLLVFYYHGRAAGKKEDYIWRFSKSMKEVIDAHNIITKICACDADSLLLLDCELPTCMTNKFFREFGSTEMVHSGGYLRDVDGQLAAEEGDSFTECILAGLQNHAMKIRNPKKGHNEYLNTMREVMKGYDELSYKAGTIHIQGKEGDERVRTRIGRCPTLEPPLEFKRKIKVIEKDSKSSPEPEAEMEDEGFEEMEIEPAKGDEDGSHCTGGNGGDAGGDGQGGTNGHDHGDQSGGKSPLFMPEDGDVF